jgi:hypothetical protein
VYHIAHNTQEDCDKDPQTYAVEREEVSYWRRFGHWRERAVVIQLTRVDALRTANLEVALCDSMS